jgi:hypothetical protein
VLGNFDDLQIFISFKVTFREIQAAPQLQDVPSPIPPSISLAKQGYPLEYLNKGFQ